MSNTKSSVNSELALKINLDLIMQWRTSNTNIQNKYKRQISLTRTHRLYSSQIMHRGRELLNIIKGLKNKSFNGDAKGLQYYCQWLKVATFDRLIHSICIPSAKIRKPCIWLKFGTYLKNSQLTHERCAHVCTPRVRQFMFWHLWSMDTDTDIGHNTITDTPSPLIIWRRKKNII